jgi:hypothetical protein
MKPRFRSLVLVSNDARITRPKRKVDGINEVIKAEQLKTRVFEQADKASALDIARVMGKEGLEQFARGLAALHRPSDVDWAARFGVPASPPPAAPSVVAPPSAPETRRPWLVKYDGPCSSCGRLLTKGTPAVWDNAKRKMFCLDCRPAA